MKKMVLNTIDTDLKKIPGQLSIDLFSQDKKNINVIVYCGFEGIEELVFASSSDEETINKMYELKAECDALDVEASTYGSEDELEDLLDKEEDRDLARKYAKLLNHNKADRYCVQTYSDGKFKCSCNELGVSPKEPWLY